MRREGRVAGVPAKGTYRRVRPRNIFVDNYKRYLTGDLADTDQVRPSLSRKEQLAFIKAARAAHPKNKFRAAPKSQSMLTEAQHKSVWNYGKDYLHKSVSSHEKKRRVTVEMKESMAY
jgi:hypothetical protein